MYFKVEDPVTKDSQQEDYYDPRVCNMKDSDIWKIVYD